jgi:hypothetical protein
MNRYSKLSSVFLAALLLGLFNLAGPAASSAQNESEFDEASKQVDKIAAISYVTWWAHDASAGYHPTLLLKIENYSNKDLTGTLLRFQARFIDLTDGITSTAKRDVRQSFVPHQQIYVLLKGPQAFDLPIDEYNWPMIECKVMCRVGEVGDEGTQTLIVTKLESITMNEDEAMQKMSRLADFSRTRPPRAAAARNTRTTGSSNHPAKPEKPMRAMAGRLSGISEPPKGKPKTAPKSLLSLLTSRDRPGLGEDFYNFERSYGMPSATDTSDQDWTWATFLQSQPTFTVIAGSKGSTGKVDVIVLKVPDEEIGKEANLPVVSSALSGIFKSQKPGQTSHSVRYLPSGRLHLLTCKAPGYESCFFAASPKPQDGNSAFLVLSRVPGNLVDFLCEHGKRVAVLEQAAAVLTGK